MPDTVVNVPNSLTATSAPIDSAQVTRADGTVADRQRLVLSDAQKAGADAPVDPTLGLRVDLSQQIYELMLEQTKLLRAMWLMWTAYTGIKVDPDDMIQPRSE